MWNEFAPAIIENVKVGLFMANKRTTMPQRGTCRFVAERQRERPE